MEILISIILQKRQFITDKGENNGFNKVSGSLGLVFVKSEAKGLQKLKCVK